MEIINQTTFTKQLHYTLNNFILKKLLKKLVPLCTFIFIMGVVLVILDADDSFSVFFLVFGLIYIPLIILIQRISARALNKQYSVMQENPVYTFRFEEDSLDISFTGSTTNGQMKMAYDKFHKVYETDAYFIFMLNQQQAYLAGKANFTSGTAEEAKALLNRKITNPKVNKLKK